MRNKLLVGAVVLVGLASVAYAAFTQSLTINGTGNATGSWNVAITGITQTAAVGATEVSAPTFNATSATFDVNLQYPGAYATYNVTVTNSGTIPATLDAVTDLTTLNAAAPSYITYGVSGVVAGTTTLAPSGGTNVATVTVEWDNASAPVTTGTTKSATITLDYTQTP